MKSQRPETSFNYSDQILQSRAFWWEQQCEHQRIIGAHVRISQVNSSNYTSLRNIHIYSTIGCEICQFFPAQLPRSIPYFHSINLRNSLGSSALQPNQIFKYVRDRRQLSASRVNTTNCAASTSLLSLLHYVCVACLHQAFFAYRYIVRRRLSILLLHNDHRPCSYGRVHCCTIQWWKNGWLFKGLLNVAFWSKTDKMSPCRSIWTENAEEKMFA